MNQTYPERQELLKEVKKVFEQRNPTVKRKYESKYTATTYELLSIDVEEKTKDYIDLSTIKRLYRYAGKECNPRIRILNILSRYAGYESFTEFCVHLQKDSDIESSFLSERNVPSKDLFLSEYLEIGWQPNRYLLVQYLGNNRFEVKESRNAKLSEGDQFTCTEFIVGHPLYVSDIKHGTENIPTYLAGRQNGLTLLNIVDPEL